MISAIAILILLVASVAYGTSPSLLDDEKKNRRIHQAKLELWTYGAFSQNDLDNVAEFEIQVAKAPIRHGPVREVRRRLLQDMQLGDTSNVWKSILNVRGGDGGVGEENDDHAHAAAARLDKKLRELGVKFGQPFIDAIEQVSYYICTYMWYTNYYIYICIYFAIIFTYLMYC